MGDADNHRAAIGGHIVDTERKGNTGGIGEEVMVVDFHRSEVPFGAVVLKVSHHFSFLSIDADDGEMLAFEAVF